MARSGRFGTFLVGVGSTSTLKPSFASRFCELISIDVEKFRSLMIDQAQEAENLPINVSWQECLSRDWDCWGGKQPTQRVWRSKRLILFCFSLRPEVFDMLVIYSSIDNDCLNPSCFFQMLPELQTTSCLGMIRVGHPIGLRYDSGTFCCLLRLRSKGPAEVFGGHFNTE